MGRDAAGATSAANETPLGTNVAPQSSDGDCEVKLLNAILAFWAFAVHVAANAQAFENCSMIIVHVATDGKQSSQTAKFKLVRSEEGATVYTIVLENRHASIVHNSGRPID